MCFVGVNNGAFTGFCCCHVTDVLLSLKLVVNSSTGWPHLKANQRRQEVVLGYWLDFQVAVWSSLRTAQTSYSTPSEVI